MATKKLNRPKFSSEAELCEAFRGEARRQRWTVYPECDDWDLLLVDGGLHVGVQAKLRTSTDVLSQCVMRLRKIQGSGPDYVATLTQWLDEPFNCVAEALGVVVFAPRLPVWREPPGLIWPNLREKIDVAPQHCFAKSAWLPPVASNEAAGTPSPIRLTEWKWAALRLCARLEIRGWVTVRDFGEIGLDSSRWYGYWLEAIDRSEKPIRWRRGRDEIKFPGQHPEAYEEAMRISRLELSGEVLPYYQTRLPLISSSS